MKLAPAAVVCAALLLTGSIFSTSRAETTPATPAVGAPVEEAQRRFKKALELYGHGEREAALVELRRAYELAPAYRILYNLGQVAFAVGEHAAALGYFERYLEEGGVRVPEPRRREVRATLEELRGRTGTLELVGVAPRDEVLLDDARVSARGGRLVVNAGRRRVDVVSPTGERRAQVVDVAGGVTVRVAFSPPKPAPTPAAAPPARPRAPAPIALAVPQPKNEPATIALPQSSNEPTTLTSPKPNARHRNWYPWASWTAAGAVALGAAVTGTFAMRTSRDLDRSLSEYPVAESDVAGMRSDLRTLSLTTDGLIVGAALLTGLSVYLSFRRPSD